MSNELIPSKGNTLPFPITHWLKTYTREDINGGLSAGFIATVLLVTQGTTLGIRLICHRKRAYMPTL